MPDDIVINLSINHCTDGRVHINESISQSINQSVNQSSDSDIDLEDVEDLDDDNQSINQSIDEPTVPNLIFDAASMQNLSPLPSSDTQRKNIISNSHREQINQPINQSVNQSKKRIVKQSIPWWQDSTDPLSVCKHSNHPYQLVFASQVDLQSHSINQHGIYHCFHVQCTANNQPISQSINQSNNQSNNQSISQSINQVTFSSVEEFQQHIAQHVYHQLQQNQSPNQSINQSINQLPPHCNHCGQIFYSDSLRTEHLHSHQRPFLCLTCPARFASRDAQSKHSRKHRNQRHDEKNHKRQKTQSATS